MCFSNFVIRLSYIVLKISGGKAYRFLLKNNVNLFHLSKVHNYKQAWIFQRLISDYSCQMTKNVNDDQRYRKNIQRLCFVANHFVL